MSSAPAGAGVVGVGWGFRWAAKSAELTAALHLGQKSVSFYGGYMIRPPRALQKLYQKRFSMDGPPAPPGLPTIERKSLCRSRRAAINRGRPPSRRGEKPPLCKGRWHQFADWCRKGCNLPFFDHLSSRTAHAGYNPPRRRGLRIAPNTASGISRSLRRSSSPKHNRYAGLCLGPLWADSPLCTRGPLAGTVSIPNLRPRRAGAS